MNKLLRFSTTSIAALAIAMAPLPATAILNHWLGDSSAYAAGNSGNHGNSGSGGSNASNGNGSANSSNGSGNGGENSGGSNASNGNGSASSSNGIGHRTAQGGNAAHENIAALAGFGNAAHASVQGLLHANPGSAVGRLKIYADLHFAVMQLQTAVSTDQATVLADKAAVASAQTAYDNLVAQQNDPSVLAADKPTNQQVADALTALDAAKSALATAQTTLSDAQTALAGATTKANDALALATKNPDNPAVQAYIDGLLKKYYSYLASL